MPPSHALAIHTSSPDLGLALTSVVGDDGGDRAQVWHLDRAQSSHIHPCLLEFLPPQTWADLAFLAVAQGPGGFTGTRIGVVTARTLAQQLDIPLFGISSLAAMAHLQVAAEPQPAIAAETLDITDIAVELPAHKGATYGAIYRHTPDGLQTVMADTVLPIAHWQELLQQRDRPYRLCAITGNLGHGVTGVLQLAKLAWQQGARPHWSEIVPFYGADVAASR